MYTIALKSQVFDRMSDDEFVHFCLENRDLRIERTAEGEILVDMPAYPKTGKKNAELIYQLIAWNKKPNAAGCSILRPAFSCGVLPCARPMPPGSATSGGTPFPSRTRINSRTSARIS